MTKRVIDADAILEHAAPLTSPTSGHDTRSLLRHPLDEGVGTSSHHRSSRR